MLHYMQRNCTQHSFRTASSIIASVLLSCSAYLIVQLTIMCIVYIERQHIGALHPDVLFLVSTKITHVNSGLFKVRSMLSY